MAEFLQGSGAGAVQGGLVALEGQVGVLRQGHGGGEEVGRGFGQDALVVLVLLGLVLLLVLLRALLLVGLLVAFAGALDHQVVPRVAGEEGGFGVGDPSKTP